MDIGVELMGLEPMLLTIPEVAVGEAVPAEDFS